MLRYMQRQPPDPEAVKSLAAAHSIPPLLAGALLQRGIAEEEAVRAFLHPSSTQLHDPLLLPGMRAAVSRIRLAVAQHERIAVYGDYDADGVCATAILLQYFRTLGAEVEAYLPSRHGDGYGMHETGVRALHERGVRLIITVDNGISAAREVALCYELDMQVIVTDHHQCPEELPMCEAVVNPHRPDSTYPYPNLCGAGVALKLVQALGGLPAVRDYLAVAAVATVADVVELLGENRVIVALGMPLAKKHVGLRALLEVSGSTGQAVDSGTLAFRIAPRLNAAGRMGEADLALELLLEQDAAAVHAIALTLNERNTARQQREQAIQREAQHMLQGQDTVSMRAILLASSGWNPGIIGIVAARLREIYYRPVLLFHQEGELLTGSCRSIPGVDLYQCLSAHSGYFERFGGHAQAAGITMKAEKLEPFRQAFQAYLEEAILPDVFLPTAFYEQETQLSQLNYADVEQLGALAPFGTGNADPVLRIAPASLEAIARMGREDAHLRATAVQGRTRAGLVAFGYGGQAKRLEHAGELDLLVTASLNEWMGKSSLQLQLQAVRPYSPLEQPDAGLLLRRNFYDAFFSNFLYNGTHSAKWITLADWEQRLLRRVKAGYAGLLVLCFTPAGMERLRALLQQHALLDRFAVHVGELPEGDAYHSILLAPVLARLYAENFAEVFSPDAEGFCEKMPAQLQEAGLYRPELPTVGEVLLPLRLGREAMAKLYAAFLHVLQEDPLPRERLLQACGAAGYETALLALLVFIELGFFYWDAGGDVVGRVQGCAKRDLMESGLYAAANSNV